MSRLCSYSRSFTSSLQICDWINIHLVAENWKCEISQKWRLVHRESTNIDTISNCRARDESAAETVQSTYRLCRDTITTQIINSSEISYHVRCRVHVKTDSNDPVPGRKQIPNQSWNLDLFVTQVAAFALSIGAMLWAAGCDIEQHHTGFIW
jgi:hypothetical protein